MTGVFTCGFEVGATINALKIKKCSSQWGTFFVNN
jgi:hypothetical protein